MLYAHNDVKLWGAQFKMAAGRAGIPCELFQHPDEVPEGARAFVRLDQQAEQRAISKGILERLHQRDAGIVTLPRRVEGEWYDDKISQLPILARWMPNTFISRRYEDGEYFLDNVGAYPFISKAAEGSASKAVRLIRNREEAERELKEVFYGDGLPTVYDRRQRGYVYWQQFMERNDCDIRIVIMGNYLMGLRRWNRKDKPFASGSGNNQPIQNLHDDEEARAAALLCMEISKEIKTRWMAYDVVFDPRTKQPKVLEMSSSWTPHSYSMCPLFVYSLTDMVLRSARRYKADFEWGGAMFDCAVEVLQAGG